MPVLACQPPRVGAQLGRREARCLVDVQADVAQPLDGFRQARPLFVGEPAGAQVRLVDAPDRADDTHRQLRRAHFHREHGHRQLGVQRHVLGDVDGERRLAHGGARRQHHQVALLQAGGHAVEVVEAGGHTRHVVRVVRHLLHAIQQFHHQGFHRLEALLHARAFLADVEDLLLRLVEDLVHRLALRVEGAGGDVVAGGHQLAQDRPLAHDLGVTADVAGTGHILRQRVQVGQPAHLVALALALQLFIHRDHVGGLGFVDQLAAGGVDQAVLVAVEIAVDQQVADAVPGVVAQQQTSQHAGFGLDRVWRNAQLGHLPVGRRVVVEIRVGSGIAGREGGGHERVRMRRRPPGAERSILRRRTPPVMGQACGQPVQCRCIRGDKAVHRPCRRKKPRGLPRGFFGGAGAHPGSGLRRFRRRPTR